jgi:hypothetical protein
MTTTYTANKGYPKQGTGDNANTWGVILNTGIFDVVDANLGGRLSIDCSGSSNVTPNATQAANIYQKMTGTLTGNIDYRLPAAAGGIYLLKNSTSGAFTLTAKPLGGAGLVVPQGTTIATFLNPDTGTLTGLFDSLPNLGITSSTTPAGGNGIYLPSAGTIGIYANSALAAIIANPSSAVNYLALSGSATGSALGISAVGSDTNIDISLTPKGTGVVKVNGALNYAAENTIAAGSTVDLGTTTSNNVLVNGAGSTITSLGTLPAGATRYIRFNGTNVINQNGASLILPTTQNITTAPNDMMTAVSLGSGNWIITQYQRSNGNPLGGIVKTQARNLRAQGNGTGSLQNSQVVITADEMVLTNSIGEPILVTNVNVTVDITVSGVGGLDTGAEAANTFYYFYVAAKADGTLSGYFSLGSVRPSVTSGGYDFTGCAGCVMNDISGNFLRFRQRGNCNYYAEGVPVLSNGSATVETAVSVASAVPFNALSFTMIDLISGAAGSNGILAMNVDYGYFPGKIFYHQYRNTSGNAPGAGSDWFPTSWFEMPNDGQNMYYKTATASGSNISVYIYVMGYKLPICAD